MPKLSVFICHSSSDKPAARELYQRLKREGYEPWLDEEDLLPGQEWRKEIPKAVAKAHVVIVCLSETAVTKHGFVQKEIGYALDVASEQPEGTIYIIPVRLEQCEVPNRLSAWQWVDLFEPRGYERLLRSLRIRAESLRLSAPDTRDRSQQSGGSPSPATAAPAPAGGGKDSGPDRGLNAVPKTPRVPPGPTGNRGAHPSSVPVSSSPVEEEGFGVAMGFNLFTLNGNPFMAEAEISSYVDDPQALGVTLVFHPMDYSLVRSDHDDAHSWRWDIDDDLERDESTSTKEQFRSIARQLSRFSGEHLRHYLLRAMRDAPPPPPA